ncbi:sensor histidine kinase [Microvirga pudoricolor]|uniref:sensor histidine kinase n=1 Tax=Microvirga pudoricolor TaxID=2778729 RepID=UPI00194F4805|nr:histidine kinase dimerization/phosphoacceptor domain -containing protein [Microvirga pudoricolor]MBM6596208.1 ATP-binding protein [Microvirga pudoricolor]
MIPVRDVRTVLYATALLFAVAIIGMRGTFVWLEYRYAMNRAEAATQDLALLMEEYTKRTLETGDLLLKDIIEYVALKGGADALKGSREAHDLLVDMTQRSSAGDLFLIMDRNGNAVSMTGAFPVADMSFADRRWFKAHRAGADTIVGGAILGQYNKEILYTYTRRIPDVKGDFDGVAMVALRPTFLQEVSNMNENAGDLVLGIWDRDGSVIARTDLTPDRTNATLARSRLFTDFTSQKAGTYRSDRTSDSAERIVSFRRLERWPVTVTASIPVAAALSVWWQGLYWSIAVTIIVLVALAWLTWFGIRLSYRTEETQRSLHDLNRELGQANDSLAKALSDKVVLLKEIHHRVKNNLQVTSSLLQLQARRFKDPDVKTAFQETQDRLRSIGLIHDTLYRTDTGGTINLQDYFGRLIGELSAAYGAAARGIELDLDADPIAIDLEKAIPLALTVTEAISNAFKHAFAPDQEGQIAVSVHRSDSGLEVTVRDNGRGLIGNKDDPSSLGTKLIRAFAAQLGGHVSLTSENGTVFRLTMPL